MCEHTCCTAAHSSGASIAHGFEEGKGLLNASVMCFAMSWRSATILLESPGGSDFTCENANGGFEVGWVMGSSNMSSALISRMKSGIGCMSKMCCAAPCKIENSIALILFWVRV